MTRVSIYHGWWEQLSEDETKNCLKSSLMQHLIRIVS